VVRQIVYTVTIILLSLGLALSFISPMQVTSQAPTSQPQLNGVIQDVLKAEKAGAQPEEMQKLADELNSLLPLEDQLQELGPQETDNRSQLLAEINSKLVSVDLQAMQIEAASSHRTMTERITAYSFAGIAALLATIASHYTLLLLRKSRTKRALQSKIVPR